jgi:hypothetical protein
MIPVLGTNPYYGTTWDDDLRAKAIMSSLGVVGSDIQTPGDLLELTRAANESGMSGLGQYPPTGYSYYGSPYPGAQPQKTSDWDKFMQFHNSMMPALTNILGTWMQSRAQVQTAQQQKEAAIAMSKNMAALPPQQQQQLMQGYLVNQMMAQQGGQTTMNPMQMQVMGQAFGQMPPQQFNQAYQGAMANLSQAAGGNAQIQAMLNRQGAMLRGGASGQIPGWVIIGGLVAAGLVVYFGFIAPKMG